jgi:hypothetical protein
MPRTGRPRVILHIGGAKCGSSAIQAYLARNRDALAGRGLAVPGIALDFASDVTGEQIWFFEDAVTAADLSRVGTKFRALLGAVEREGFREVVVSAENICNHPSLAPMLAETLSDAEVRVVFYVRRQDDFLISSWQQWNLKRFDSVESFLSARMGQDARWLTMITPWAEVFGDTQITVRPFLRSRLKNGDVIDDFFDVIGMSQDGLLPLAENANPSFDEALARLAHRVRDVFDGPHDNRFYDVMARLLGQAAMKKGSASSLLSLEARQEIMEFYTDENAGLKARFMPDLGAGPLFPMPSAHDVVEKSEAERLSDDIAMLTRAVFALAARQDEHRA